MSDLVDFVRKSEAAICETFAEKLKVVDCQPFGEAVGYDCRPMLEAIVRFCEQKDTSAAKAWAGALGEQASQRSLTYPHILAGLRCLLAAIREHATAHLSSPFLLAAAMEELDEAIDLLRGSCAEVSLGERDDSRIQRHQFAALAEDSSDFICLATLHGKTFYLNPAGRRLIGLSTDEDVTGTSLHDFHPETAWSELRDVAVPAVNRRGRWEGHSQISHRKTSELIDVATTMFLVKSPQTGKPSCLAMIHRLKEQESLSDALNESEARKHAILESSLDPIITINHEGVITEFNRAAEHVFGYPRSEVLGTQPSEVLFPPSKMSSHQDRIDRYLEAGEGSMLGKRVEVTAVRASGESFPAEMAMTLNRQHGLPVMTFFVRDISQQKRAEEEQARYAADLERSNQELEQFAYVASHDLQEPLRKIRTFGDRLQSLCGSSLEPTALECLQRMQNAAERMQTLINGILSLSRVMTHGQDFVPVDLGQIAGEVLSDLEVEIEQTGATVELGTLLTIQADPLQIRQLLQNLIGNALKFRHENVPPVIKVHSRYLRGREPRSTRETPAEEQCRITVEDNGIGFEEKYADRIFGIFQRLHTREAYPGTGIGLAICRKIAERHGGTITARSGVDQGATFEVLLPVYHRKPKS
jgi:two-component system sensor kinase FixL